MAITFTDPQPFRTWQTNATQVKVTSTGQPLNPGPWCTSTWTAGCGPGAPGYEVPDELIARLAAAGLADVEVWHPEHPAA